MQDSSPLKSSTHVGSAPINDKNLEQNSQSCSSVGCNTSFELDAQSPPVKSFCKGVHKTEPSALETCYVEEGPLSIISEMNLSEAIQNDMQREHIGQNNRKMSELGVMQATSPVCDTSFEGRRSKLPYKSQTSPTKLKNSDASESSSKVMDGRCGEILTNDKQRNNVAIQSDPQLSSTISDKIKADSPSAGNHMLIRNSTQYHSFMESDYDAINNYNKYDFTIPNTLSMESCHSSLYSDEMSATYSSYKDTRSTLPPLHRKSGTSKIDQQDTISFTNSLHKSFSLSSFHSANTTLSKASSLSHEEVERCISYTLSELGRIHSMLDDANMDSMSCTSDSTEGRDVLYYARQSKNEIAALHHLIEQHINREKEGNDNHGNKLSSKNGSYLSNNITVIGQSSSFETMVSAKSQWSMVEGQSIDQLILDVNKLCTDIETRIENIVNDTNDGH